MFCKEITEFIICEKSPLKSEISIGNLSILSDFVEGSKGFSEFLSILGN